MCILQNKANSYVNTISWHETNFSGDRTRKPWRKCLNAWWQRKGLRNDRSTGASTWKERTAPITVCAASPEGRPSWCYFNGKGQTEPTSLTGIRNWDRGDDSSCKVGDNIKNECIRGSPQTAHKPCTGAVSGQALCTHAWRRLHSPVRAARPRRVSVSHTG